MKKALLILFCATASLAASAQAWTYYPYGGSSAQAFKVPNPRIYDATTIKLVHDSSDVMIAYKFDQVSDTLAVWAESAPNGDIGRTILASDGSTQTPGTWDQIARLSWEKKSTPTATAFKYMKWNGNPNAFENFVGATAFYTVNFTESGVYNLVMRLRGGGGNAYVVEAYEKSNMGIVFQDLSFNSAGLSVAATLLATGTKSTDLSCEYLTEGKLINTTGGQGNSLWLKVVSNTITISTPGEYVIKVKQSAGNSGNSFGGFTFFKEVVTGAKANTLKADMFVSNNVLNISGNEGVSTVSVYDISGKQMMVKTVSSASVQLPLNLKNGLYVVTMEGVGGKLTKKVVVR